MRVLVTGGAGFIGSHVVEAYLAAGHEVWALDNLSRGRRERVPSAARFVEMDVRAPGLRDLLAEARVDCVNHHAAQIDVRQSVADPAADAAVNILGSLNLLEAARSAGVPRCIFASTGGAIYGEPRRMPVDETHPARPLSPYGVAKLAVEHYLDYYATVHSLRAVVLRYANVYGPRQDPEGEAGVVAIFAGRLLRGEPLLIYGDGEQTRDYVFVGDVARANVLALDWPGARRPDAGRELPVFNIGTGVETSVNALASQLLQAADQDSAIHHRPARLGEQARSVIDAARARRLLGWEPRIGLPEGLRACLESMQPGLPALGARA